MEMKESSNSLISENWKLREIPIEKLSQSQIRKKIQLKDTEQRSFHLAEKIYGIPQRNFEVETKINESIHNNRKFGSSKL